MEGTPRPSYRTSLIFSSVWPITDILERDLVEAVTRGLDDWVVIPLPGIGHEALQEEAQELSMRMQGF